MIEALREELLAMERRDSSTRAELLGAGGLFDGYDPRMMGFFSGVPYPEKAAIGGATPHLDCIFLYKRNLERECQGREELEAEIRITLLHETGHFFGLSEEELDAMGLG